MRKPLKYKLQVRKTIIKLTQQKDKKMKNGHREKLMRMIDFDGIYKMTENSDDPILKVYSIPGLENPLRKILVDIQERPANDQS